MLCCFALHLSALQIFQKESHPSVYKMGAGNSGAKEGLSLFGNLCIQSKTLLKARSYNNCLWDLVATSGKTKDLKSNIVLQ